MIRQKRVPSAAVSYSRKHFGMNRLYVQSTTHTGWNSIENKVFLNKRNLLIEKPLVFISTQKSSLPDIAGSLTCTEDLGY